MGKLTPREQKVLSFLKDEVRRINYPPSVREICKALGINSTSTVHKHLNSLDSKGYIRRDPAKTRAISIIEIEEDVKADTSCSFAPIIGRITAGLPVLADENLEGYLPLPAYLNPESDCFALKLKGSSMSGAGILNGDYVVARRQDTAENGEIVVALLENEATVKRFFRDRNVIRLQPENPAYQAIFPQKAVILGKVIAVFRML